MTHWQEPDIPASKSTRKPAKPDIATIARQWWSDLISEKPGRRAARARLRRAATPLEVIQEPTALRLIERLPSENWDQVAILAGILAVVREDDKTKLARAIGRKKIDDKEAVMSEPRFRRLLQSRDEELLDAMRRLVLLNKGKANVTDLSFAILRWGGSIKKRWIFRYYGVSESSPRQGGASNASPVPSSN